MFAIRKAAERGVTQFEWLDSRHTFSFGDYYDPKNMHYRSLRVINDDRIAPGGGFPTHPHRDMEIISIMLAGRLAHRDSLGSVQEIGPGEVQVMTAGTGISHSEFNPSDTEPAHLLQVWLLPERKGLPPRYDQRSFEAPPGQWQVIASRDRRDGSLPIKQDAVVALAAVRPGDQLDWPAAADRGLWLHVATGAVTANGRRLNAGDAAAIEGEPLVIDAIEPGQLLLFDLK